MQNVFQPGQTHRRHCRASEKICQSGQEVMAVQHQCQWMFTRLIVRIWKCVLKNVKIMRLSWNGLTLNSFSVFSFFTISSLFLISCVKQGIMSEQRTNLWAGSWDVCTHCRCQKPLLQTAAWVWFPQDIYWPASQTEHSKVSSSKLIKIHPDGLLPWWRLNTINGCLDSQKLEETAREDWHIQKYFMPNT